MTLIDTHAHLTYPGLVERIDEVLANCAREGVGELITIGTDLADAAAALKVAEHYPDRVHAAVGFHPHHAGEVDDAALSRMVELWSHERVVAFGEMGLDYHYDHADRAAQHRVFEGQLAAAAERDRALIIHCRDAFVDVVPRLLAHGFARRRVVFHCFTGTREETEIIASHGWRISFTGIVTFKKSEWLQEIARGYPADHLMVETDAPYLSPEPVRRITPNEPAHVAHVARFLAKLRGISYEELVAQTCANTRSFFGLQRSTAVDRRTPHRAQRSIGQ